MMPSHNVRILVATQPVDFRKGHDGLAALVQSVLKEAPFTIYLAIRSFEKTGRAVREWIAARNQFAMLYPERFNR